MFGIHPLTTEDVLTEESREKCEIFRNYMFVCYRAFNQDHYSADFLKPINFYNIVFKHGIVTVQFFSSLTLVSCESFLIVPPYPVPFRVLTSPAQCSQKS